jgi:hypothetical protein
VCVGKELGLVNDMKHDRYLKARKELAARQQQQLDQA